MRLHERLREATRSLQVRTIHISFVRLMRLGSSLKYGTNKVLRFAHRSPIAWRLTGGAPKVKAGNFKFFVVESRSSAFRAQQTRESAVPVIACLARLK